MKLCILTEGDLHTGYGHVVRCMALAKSFRACHVEVLFCINGDNHVVSMLSEYPVKSFNWTKESENLRSLLTDVQFVLIDSYLAEQSLYERIYRQVPICIYLDDFNRLDYPPGIIMNGTMGAEEIGYKKNVDRVYFLGKDYIILRDSFKCLLPEKKVSDSIRTVLITFGGTDPLGLSLKILSKLVKSYPQIRKIVILGAAFDQQEKIKAIADASTELYYNVDAELMKNLMLSADLAISAAGQTLNELAVVGVPSVIFKVADNQDNNIKGWIQHGFINTFIDATNEWSEEYLDKSISELADPVFRKKLSENGRRLVDKRGGERLVKYVLLTYIRRKVVISEAAKKDIYPLYELANDDEVRANSFSTDKIAWEDHVKWFQSLQEDSNRILYVFYIDDLLVGQVRFDKKDSDEAVISISIAALFRGIGFASDMLRMAIDKMRRRPVSFCKSIYAFVKVENIASRMSFIKAGFCECKSDNNEIKKYMIYVESEYI